MKNIIEITEQVEIPSITFLNLTGDITIIFDEKNREQILAMIRKKMSEGYSFFTTKKFMFDKFKRKQKITEKNIEQVEEIVITDAQFEKMIVDMNDKDIATLVRDETVTLAKRRGKTEITLHERAKNAEDVIDKNSVAIRPIVGG